MSGSFTSWDSSQYVPFIIDYFFLPLSVVFMVATAYVGGPK